MLYSNIYEPDERVAEYQSYNEAMTKVDDLMEWYSEASSDESDSEVFINAKEYNNNVIEYNLSPQDVQTENNLLILSVMQFMHQLICMKIL